MGATGQYHPHEPMDRQAGHARSVSHHLSRGGLPPALVTVNEGRAVARL